MVDFRPIIVHVDMDAFFAAVEIRNNPKLQGKPVIVGGGIGPRGVVSTCSYEARRYGVHSGMAIMKARRLCPHGEFISAELHGYVFASAMLQTIMEQYSPRVEPLSVDEAFLDITGTERLYGGPEALVQAMKQEIAERLKLTCSVGIAPSKYLAKLASGLEKPNGMTILSRDRFREVFYPRPVDVLWGVGESTKKTLAAQGIITVGDLAGSKTSFLKGIFGKNGDTLSVMSRGTEDSEVLRYHEMPHDKSMSHETTMREDIQDPSLIRATILWLSDRVARRMRKYGYMGRTISVKIRSSDFTTITRSHTINAMTDRCDIIYHCARKLIPKEYGMKYKVRLLGVRVSQLHKVADGEKDPQEGLVTGSGQQQLELTVDTKTGQLARLTKAVDAIRDKFGDQSIKLAGTMRS
jgi:DNA polymerase-4